MGEGVRGEAQALLDGVEHGAAAGVDGPVRHVAGTVAAQDAVRAVAGFLLAQGALYPQRHLA